MEAAGNNKGFTVPAYFAAFIIYASSCVVAEILYLLTALPYLYDVVIAVAAGVVLYSRLWKSDYLKFPVWTRWDVAAAVAFCIAFFVRCYAPTADMDSVSYHLIHQEPFPMSQVSESFFPSSSLHTFLPPLGDRMFFLFRYVLGIRMGTILNLLVVLLLYFQIKEIMMFATPNFDRRRPGVLAIFSFSAVALIVRMTGPLNIYWVDFLSAPIVFYFTWCFLANVRITLRGLIFSAYLFGLAFSMKMNAGVMAGMFLLYFVWANREEVTVKGTVSAVIFACIPIVPFLVAPYQQTGSPFFPYLGQVFPSPYFPYPEDSQLVFGRWLQNGPQGILAYLFFPFYAVLGIHQSSPPVMLLFLISLFGLAMVWWRHLGMTKNVRLVVLYLVSYVFLLAVCHGDIRYDCLFLALIAVTLFFLYQQLVRTTRKDAILAYGTLALLSLVVVHTLVAVIFWCDVPKARAKGDPVPIYQEERSVVLANAAKIFRDQSTGIPDEALSDVRAWLSPFSFRFSAGYEYLLKPSAPIISLGGYVPLFGDPEKYKGSFGEEKYRELLAQYEDGGLYAVLVVNAKGSGTYGDFFQWLLKNHHMKVASMQTLHPNFIAAHQSLQMAEIRKADAPCTFQQIIADKDAVILGTCDAGERKRLEAFVGYQPEIAGTVLQKPFSATIMVRKKGTGNILFSETIRAEDAFAPVTLPVEGGAEGCEVLLAPGQGNASYGTLALCYWEADE